MPLTTPRRVLVLDDDQVLLDLTEAFLSLAGYGVTVFASSEGALAALRADPTFDLVLSDLNMPGLQGEALTRALRSAMPIHAALVGMSATRPSAETAAHFDAFLLKPFDPGTLQNAMGTAMATAREGRAAAEPPAPVSTEAPPPQSTGPILDETIMGSLARAIPPPQLRKLYEMGIADVEKRHARMQDAAAAGDLASLQREAHAIKGSCGMVGALELQALATALEGGTTLNTSALAEIPGACLRLRRMLDDKLQTV